MIPFDWQSELHRNEHRVVLSGQPIAMHCHHYNINLQKMLEDSLGEKGVRLLYRAAEKSAFPLFKTFLDQYPEIRTVKSKLEIAAILYQNCGLGIVHPQQMGPDGGDILSPSSHYVTGWLAKHGRRGTPGCHFARGWIAGVLEVIYGKPLGHYEVAEHKCKMMRDDACVFQVVKR